MALGEQTAARHRDGAGYSRGVQIEGHIESRQTGADQEGGSVPRHGRERAGRPRIAHVAG